jgi:hypothetical protein
MNEQEHAENEDGTPEPTPKFVKVPTRFERGEFNAFINEVAGPARDDDTPVLMGANGRRATPEELRAWAEAEIRRQRGEG